MNWTRWTRLRTERPMTKRHKCTFTAPHTPIGDNEHAHECLVCDEMVFVGSGVKCDLKPNTHRESRSHEVARSLFGNEVKLPCVEHTWRLAMSPVGVCHWQCEVCDALAVTNPCGRRRRSVSR